MEPGRAPAAPVKTPGQAFTLEWGLGQVLPLKKNFSQLLQVGLVGYDQWQITANSGGTKTADWVDQLYCPASTLPYYSVHALGGQGTYILPMKNLTFFVKGYHEYTAYSHFVGTTISFGGSWTLRIPKPAPPPKTLNTDRLATSRIFQFPHEYDSPGHSLSGLPPANLNVRPN